MDDKCIMENILLTEKGVCDLFLHGTIESSERFPLHAGRALQKDGSEGLVSHRAG